MWVSMWSDGGEFEFVPFKPEPEVGNMGAGDGGAGAGCGMGGGYGSIGECNGEGMCS